MSEIAWLREIDPDTDNACWTVCAKGDPGAVSVVQSDAIQALTEEKERLQGDVSDWRDKCVDLERRVGELEEALKGQIQTSQKAAALIRKLNDERKAPSTGGPGR